jgi:hypothetical protein
LRMPLDLQFVFTANPEDYTNRGISWLRWKTESDLKLTHYPETVKLPVPLRSKKPIWMPFRATWFTFLLWPTYGTN